MPDKMDEMSEMAYPVVATEEKRKGWVRETLMFCLFGVLHLGPLAGLGPRGHGHTGRSWPRR